VKFYNDLESFLADIREELGAIPADAKSEFIRAEMLETLNADAALRMAKASAAGSSNGIIALKRTGAPVDAESAGQIDLAAIRIKTLQKQAEIWMELYDRLLAAEALERFEEDQEAIRLRNAKFNDSNAKFNEDKTVAAPDSVG
jgi:hypothetical protein